MTLQDRINTLEPRERQLLGGLVVVFLLMVLLLIPLAVRTVLTDKRELNERLALAISRIQNDSDRIASRKAEHDALVERYAKPAPPLAGFLDRIAKANNLEIPEIKDRPPKPHGKLYTERSTAISFKKAGLLSLAKFMEQIAQAPHPVSITKLDLRKRTTEPDSFDVEMTVSAFDREDKPRKSKGADKEETE